MFEDSDFDETKNSVKGVTLGAPRAKKTFYNRQSVICYNSIKNILNNCLLTLKLYLNKNLK